jgi:hypothetical protein
MSNTAPIRAHARSGRAQLRAVSNSDGEQIRYRQRELFADTREPNPASAADPTAIAQSVPTSMPSTPSPAG